MHYGFTREEILWMPISEMHDYVIIINKQQEEEQAAAEASQSSSHSETPTLRDVYRGPIG